MAYFMLFLSAKVVSSSPPMLLKQVFGVFSHFIPSPYSKKVHKTSALLQLPAWPVTLAWPINQCVTVPLKTV